MAADLGQTPTVMNESPTAIAIPPFPWPHFRLALPIVWSLLAFLLVLNPGDEYFELGIGTLPALVLATFLDPVVGGVAAVILALVAMVVGLWWIGRALDRLAASPRLFVTFWSLVAMGLLIWAGFRHHQFGRHLREGGSALVSLPLAATALGLIVAVVLSLLVALLRARRRDRARFQAWRRAFRRRGANS